METKAIETERRL